jgi:hypothetical protein
MQYCLQQYNNIQQLEEEPALSVARGCTEASCLNHHQMGGVSFKITQPLSSSSKQQMLS